jgi:NAD+ diphosphatase
MGQAVLFSGSPLDREGQRRRDPKWVDAQIAHPDSRFLALARLEVLVKTGSDLQLAWARGEIRTSIDAEVGPVLLGTRDGVAHFAVDVSPLRDPAAELGLAGAAEFRDARAIAPRLAASEAAIVAQARSMIDWHARHRFCAACGEQTVSTQAGYARGCRDCHAEHFPRTDPVAIMLVTRGDRCLLGRQATWPASMFSALAGFIEPGETIEEAVGREVREESSIRVGEVRYLASQPWPFPSSLMIGCVAEALTERIEIDPEELEEARWFDRDTLRREIEAPGSTGQVLLPPPMAIAHQLVRLWALDGR